MTDEQTDGGIYIDSDWKVEAAREKERLAKQETEAKSSTPSSAGGAANFFELVNIMAMQSAIAMGGMQGPGGEQIPPNPAAARHYIDLLAVLEVKTKGNLTADETRVLQGVLHELRMQFVQLVGMSAPGHPAQGAQEPPGNAE